MNERKGVLLRLTPELLARVDAARGALSRTEWLVNAITLRLVDFEDADALWQVEQNQGEQEEHGEPFPLRDAALQGSGLFANTSVSASHEEGGSDRAEVPGAPVRDELGSESSSPHSESSSSEQGSSLPVDRGEREPSEGLGSGEESLAIGSQPFEGELIP